MGLYQQKVLWIFCPCSLSFFTSILATENSTAFTRDVLRRFWTWCKHTQPERGKCVWFLEKLLREIECNLWYGTFHFIAWWGYCSSSIISNTKKRLSEQTLFLTVLKLFWTGLQIIFLSIFISLIFLFFQNCFWTTFQIFLLHTI